MNESSGGDTSQRFITLVRQFRDGNTKSRDELLKACVEQISQLTNRFRRGRHGLDKAEITSNALRNVDKGIPGFRGKSDGQFLRWLARIVKNVVEDEWRRERERPTVSLHDVSPDKASTVDTPDVILEREERHKLVHRALEEMPSTYREPLVLKYYEGMKYREIAHLLGIPVGTVRSRLNKARHILKEKLKGLVGN